MYIKEAESVCSKHQSHECTTRDGKNQHDTKSNHFVTGGTKLFSELGWKSKNDNHLLESLSGKYWALPQKHDQNRCVFSPKMITFWSDIKKILRFNWYTGTSHNTLRFAPAITRVYIKRLNLWESWVHRHQSHSTIHPTSGCVSPPPKDTSVLVQRKS